MIMEQLTMCQSCSMPLTKHEDFGKNADGSSNQEYCHYCYTDGAFTTNESMEEMIESCIQFVSDGTPYKNADEARQKMNELFPKLKRWM